MRGKGARRDTRSKKDAPSPCGRGLGEGAMGRQLEHARIMRREPTAPERTLWNVLRRRTLDGLKFRRQVPFGPYIPDFYCSHAQLAVEVDGETHANNPRDTIRDEWLAVRGIRVLCFWNSDVVANLDGVLHAIRTACVETPLPPPARGGEPLDQRVKR